MSAATRRIAKIVKVLLVALLICAALLLAFIYYVGAWNIIFPSTAHDTTAPLIPVKLEAPAVLVFSKTNQFRHKDGIVAGNQALRRIALKRGWDIFATENGAVFNDGDLQRFQSIVFLNATGDMLSAPQEQALQDWLTSGGGWLGIHAAGDDSHVGWQWYQRELIGAEFAGHTMGPQLQTATVVMENHQHPLAAQLPNIWEHEEEWYSWKTSPRAAGFTVLAALDEDSYTPRQKMFNRDLDISMGDHPVVWSRCIGDGRSIYSALGHTAAAFDDVHHVKLLENALAWTLGLTGDGCVAMPASR